QIVIVERDDDITRMLNYLRENNLGKASFVSLETLRRIKVTGSVSHRPGLPIKNFVKADSKYESALEYFFGGAFLSESIEEFARNFDGSDTMTVVTKSGTIFDNGRISGGSVSENGDTLLIGRKSRLEEMKTELVEAE
ncbi:MAG: hypothetical protein Q7S07_05740, partial [Candidatus Omnitrophota bacterium]|nr:hypothetical protein [Candidatus Omnitrophota bacterium]